MSYPHYTLADGCFDPLHAGHLAYLAACRRFGDPVIVQVSPQTKRIELMPLKDRADLLIAIGYEAVTYPTTTDALHHLRPARYVKGIDWQERGVPVAEHMLCELHGITVEYVDEQPKRSSTDLLQRWAAQTADVGAAALNVEAAGQQVVPFNAEAQGYGDYDARRAIEGEHPGLLAQLCYRETVLDVGCGPGHLVRMLRERGVDAYGVDPYLSPSEPHCQLAPLESLQARTFDTVVCREVLEHVPVREVGGLLAHLFRVARRRVYLTTRFHPNPAHPFDVTDEKAADPSHITLLPQAFVRALCVVMGGQRDRLWEQALDWQRKGRVLVYEVPR